MYCRVYSVDNLVYYLKLTTVAQATEDLRQCSVYEILKKVKMCGRRGKFQIIHNVR